MQHLPTPLPALHGLLQQPLGVYIRPQQQSHIAHQHPLRLPETVLLRTAQHDASRAFVPVHQYRGDEHGVDVVSMEDAMGIEGREGGSGGVVFATGGGARSGGRAEEGSFAVRVETYQVEVGGGRCGGGDRGVGGGGVGRLGRRTIVPPSSMAVAVPSRFRRSRRSILRFGGDVLPPDGGNPLQQKVFLPRQHREADPLHAEHQDQQPRHLVQALRLVGGRHQSIAQRADGAGSAEEVEGVGKVVGDGGVGVGEGGVAFEFDFGFGDVGVHGRGGAARCRCGLRFAGVAAKRRWCHRFRAVVVVVVVAAVVGRSVVAAPRARNAVPKSPHVIAQLSIILIAIVIAFVIAIAFVIVIIVCIIIVIVIVIIPHCKTISQQTHDAIIKIRTVAGSQFRRRRKVTGETSQRPSSV
mmetsp:Transcript_30447/g.57612  ORF Transcript_30447/g.57612 Transcript_30447/m.57612 type:complete len:411 (+) Transcript_30447:2134-3366(+)